MLSLSRIKRRHQGFSRSINETDTGKTLFISLLLARQVDPAKKGFPLLALFRPGFLNLLGPGGAFGSPSPLCNFKTVHAMVTTLTQDDVNDNSKNFRFPDVSMT